MRCFIAIELSEEIKRVLDDIERELKKTVTGVKWVPPENIHLTLKFLGNIECDKTERIKEFTDNIADKRRPFAIRISSLGAFPRVEWPRVIWVGIDKGKNECSSLAADIESQCTAVGIEKENREFHPHLTLARVKSLKNKNILRNAFASIGIPQAEMLASKITLFQSTLTSEGPIYTPLHEATFTAT